MMKTCSCLTYLRIIILFFAVQPGLHAQHIELDPLNPAGPVADLYRPGFNYTPKTYAPAYSFLTNGMTDDCVTITTAQLPGGIYYLRNDVSGCLQKFIKP